MTKSLFTLGCERLIHAVEERGEEGNDPADGVLSARWSEHASEPLFLGTLLVS